MSIDFIYFDVGNVLLSFCHNRMCSQMADVAELEPEQVRRVLFDLPEAPQYHLQFETGQISSDDFFRWFCEVTRSTPDAETLKVAAADIFTPIEPMMSLVARLSEAGHSLGLLSNSNELHWEWLTDGRYPVLAEPGSSNSPFRVPIASQQVESMKPAEEIFAIAIERAGVPAERIFFADDIAENVAAARAAGIDAVQFMGTHELRKELVERGIEL